MISRIGTKRCVCALCAAWMLIVLSGFLLLSAYAAQPGDSGTPPARWPRASGVPFDRSRPNLVIFLHPECPCSRASVTELAYVLERFGNQVSAHAIVVLPKNSREGRGNRGILDNLASVPTLRTWIDQQAIETERFRVATSGHVLIFDSRGRLTYSGGITAARGHVGQSFGRDAVLAQIAGRGDTTPDSPVFGCRLATRR
jgi:hypothetical protein